MIKITSAETLVNFQQAIHCYICEDVFFFSIQLLFNIELCPQNFWCKVALLAIYVHWSSSWTGPEHWALSLYVFLNMQGCDWPSDNTLSWLSSAFRRNRQARNLFLQEFWFWYGPPSYQRQHLLAASQGHNTHHWANSCRRKFLSWWVNQNSFIIFRNKSAYSRITTVIW